MQSGESALGPRNQRNENDRLAEALVDLQFEIQKDSIPFASKKPSQIPALLNSLETMEKHAEEAKGSLLYPHLVFLIRKANELIMQNLELTRKNDELLTLYIKETLKRATLRY